MPQYNRGDRCFVTVTSTGGTSEEPPVLYPAVRCEVVNLARTGKITMYTVKLLEDVPVKGCGWYAGDTYRPSPWQLLPPEKVHA